MGLFSALLRTNAAVDVAHPQRPSPRPERTKARDDRVKARYLAGVRTPALADEFGLTRERICQILRRDNLIELQAERRRIAQEIIHNDLATVRQEKKSELHEKLARGIALVRGGMSYRAAAFQVDGAHHSNFCNLLAAECRKAGLISKRGPHRDFAQRKARLRELAVAGVCKTKTIAIIRGEGDPVHQQWIDLHCPEIEFRRAESIKQPKPARVIPPAKIAPPEFDWNGERVSDLRRHWFNGLSAQQIADIFGCTRNAVIGKVNRMRNAGELKAKQ